MQLWDQLQGMKLCFLQSLKELEVLEDGRIILIPVEPIPRHQLWAWTAETKEAITALTNLGFSKSEAREAIAAAPADQSLEQKINLAIKYLGKK